MLTKKVIVHIRKPTTLGYYSRLFLVPKPLKRWRPAIDLNILNSHLHVPTFKMETAKSIRKLIRQWEWVISIDFGLTDAYFHVPIYPQSQKYLEISNQKRGFPISGTSFWCSNSSPRVYSDCERGKTHSSSQEPQNLSVSAYLGNWLLRSPTKEQCLIDSQNLVKLVQELGWLINFQKSELVPTQKLDFLGCHFDLQRGLVFPTQKKLDLLKKSDFFHQSPRKLMLLIGTLASLENTVPLGRLHMRPFQ